MGVGSHAEEIVSVANAQKVDLISIGSSRLEKVEKLKVLGNMARKVSEIAACPVMIVH